MQKGPFWIVYEYLNDNCDFDDAILISYPVLHTTELTPSHKDVWHAVCGKFKHASWNDFPRGRVEIRRGRAIVFANPKCFCYTHFERELRKNFNLENIEIVYKTDNSSHYQYKSI